MAVVYIALGANLGNRRANLAMALRAMTRLARVRDVSSLYETAPEGPAQPPFYNAACSIETGLDPSPLLRFLQSIEDEVGRRPGGPPMGPRPIDLDVLIYDEIVSDDAVLTIPHPRLAKRAFVLVPLAEIAPEVRHPVLDQTITDMASRIDVTGVRKIEERGWDGVAGRPRGRVRI